MIVSAIDRASDSVLKQGYEVIYPPLEFKGRFEMDMQAALMNIAGISISHVTKFISYNNLIKCYNTSRNPFTNNILTIGMSDSLKIQDFFIPELVPYEIYSMPLFIHLDTSLTGDKTGIGCVAAMGYKYFNEYSMDEGEVVHTKKIMYRHVFSVGIQCPQGTEISFQKTRDFIYYLKYTLGWNIRGISTDGFQSADTRQQLLTMGFEDVSLVSLDKTPNGYLTYKAAINEKRISMLNIPELETETIRLERDNMSGKVDHPVDGCVSGDTELLMVDKKNICYSIRIDEITNNYEKYKDYRVLSRDDSGTIKLCEFINPRITKTVDKYIEIEMEDGSVIKCTHNHPIMCRNGNEYFYKHAENLTWEDNIVLVSDDLSKVVTDLRNNGLLCSKICTTIVMKIKSKKEITLDTSIPVYDIEVPETSNFTLSSGVIVHNSKDISDGLAGALYNASLHEADFSFHLVEDADTIMDTNNPTDNKDEKQGLLDSLVPTTIEKAMADMTIIDTISDMPEVEENKYKSVERIKEVQNKVPGMTLSNAMKEYLKEMSESSVPVEESTNSPKSEIDPIAEAKRKFLEAKARQQGGTINASESKSQQMQDDKDGIIMF